MASGYGGGWHGDGTQRSGIDLGRWPANVLLSEDAAAALDAQAGERTSGGYPPEGGQRSHVATYGHPNARGPQQFGGSVGGASRFFYCAKPSRKERNAGCDALPLRTRAERDGRQMGNNSKGSTNSNGQPVNGTGMRRPSGNFHPTVKPVALLRWLVRLVTPIDGTVLDCFAGSGTTGIACQAERRSCVLIERDATYLPIIRARVGATRTADARSTA
jgi:site-specific DNA-methyltransferase (adenine-specific)